MSLTTGHAIKKISPIFESWSRYYVYCYKTPVKKIANCHIKVTESIKIAKLSYFIVYLE